MAWLPAAAAGRDGKLLVPFDSGATVAFSLGKAQMIERYETDERFRLACTLLAIALIVLVGVVTSSAVWGGITGGTIAIVLGLLRVKHKRSLTR